MVIAIGQLEPAATWTRMTAGIKCGDVCDLLSDSESFVHGGGRLIWIGHGKLLRFT